MLTEFGGIAYDKFPPPGIQQVWGYSKVTGDKDFIDLYQQLQRVVSNSAMFSGFRYTQFADTFHEANGLLCADRTPKIALEKIHIATTLFDPSPST